MEESGYILAKGDRRDFVIVDQQGEVHSLARQVQGIKAKDLREFMDGVSNLPTTAEAKNAQREAREALKAVPATGVPEKTPEPTPAPRNPEIDRLAAAIAARQAQEVKSWPTGRPRKRPA